MLAKPPAAVVLWSKSHALLTSGPVVLRGLLGHLLRILVVVMVLVVSLRLIERLKMPRTDI